jgi:hypothetical protein
MIITAMNMNSKRISIKFSLVGMTVTSYFTQMLLAELLSGVAGDLLYLLVKMGLHYL